MEPLTLTNVWLKRPLAILYGPRTVLAGAALPWLQYALTGLGILLICSPLRLVASARWLVTPLLLTVGNALCLAPYLVLGFILGRKRLAWQAVSTVAFWFVLGGIAFAWELTDPVQGGMQMSPEWVRAEFRSILLECLEGALLAIVALVAAWAFARRSSLPHR